MNKERSNQIINELKIVIPNPKCELDFHNTFELTVAVLLSSQTTDKRVNQVTPILFDKYKTILDLANARYEDVYPIILPLGLAKNKSINIIHLANVIHEKYNDIIPNDMKELESLPGVGHKTASVVLALGYHIPAMPVDTHLYRMAKRLGYIKENEDIKKAEEAYKKYIPKESWIEAHHLFLLFGRYICKASNPNCKDCRLKPYCKYKV